MSSLSGNTRNWILGGVVLISVSALAYFWFFSKGTSSQTKKLKTIEPKKPTPTKPSVEQKQQAKVETKAGVTVEDVEEEEEGVEESDDEESEDEAEEEEVVQLEVKKAAEAVAAPTSETKKRKESQKEIAKAEEAEKSESSKDDAARLKEQYDDAVRLSQKYIAGGMNEKAAQKLTEAIDLTSKVPSATKDLLTLYNNRSAMYEKLGLFNESLSDIGIVFALDPLHLKARIRRARVYEAQGKFVQSLQDYVHATIMERYRGSDPQYDRKITELSKAVAIAKTDKTLKDLRSSNNTKSRAIPSKAYCRNFMEAYPNSYLWKTHYAGLARETLSQSYQDNKQKYQSSCFSSSLSAEEIAALLHSYLESGLDLIKFDLSHDCYKRAFELLDEISFQNYENEEKNNRIVKSIASQFHELMGTELHLLFQITDAMAEYQKAIDLSPANINAHLKYNAILLESGERDKALSNYAALLAALQPKTAATAEDKGASSTDGHKSDDESSDARSSSPSLLPQSLEKEKEEVKSAYLAWVLNHRASLWISRDEKGVYVPEAFNKAMKDLDDSKKQSELVLNSNEGKGAKFIALLKSVQLRTHTKQAMEIPATEQDYVENRAAIQDAKTLFPDHESVLLLEVEQLSLEGQIDQARQQVEAAAKSHKYDEFIIVNLKATITTQQAFMALQDPALHMQAQALFEEVTRCYEQALQLDPESLEVKAQFAQLKSMLLGDLQGAIDLLKAALTQARSRDEVQDILTMLANNEAQLAAVEEIRSGQKE